jgi:hypothetical protein
MRLQSFLLKEVGSRCGEIQNASGIYVVRDYSMSGGVKLMGFFCRENPNRYAAGGCRTL